MKLTKSQIRDIILEEIKSLEIENDQIEEIGRVGRFVAGLGAGAMMAAAPSTAKAEKTSASDQIHLTRSSRSPSMLASRYDDNYDGVLKNKSTGEDFVYKKDKEGITIYKLYGADKVDLNSERTMSADEAQKEFDLKPGWLRKTSTGQETPSQRFKIRENNIKITKSYLKQVIMEELENMKNK